MKQLEIICPHCENPIYDDDALRCFYCGESLNRGIGVFGKLRYPTPKIIIVIFASIVLICFVLLIIR